MSELMGGSSVNFKCLSGRNKATAVRDDACGDQISSTSSQSSSCEVKHRRLEIESFVR